MESADEIRPLPQPLMSCICVSHPSRFGLLQRAIENFQAQRYPKRELVIVVREPAYADTIRGYLRRLNQVGDGPTAPVHLYQRNFRQAVEGWMQGAIVSSGEVLVTWDDDNLSHPDRLTHQFFWTDERAPTWLSESLYYFYDSDELYVTNYAQASGPPSERCAAASMMLHRKSFAGLDAVNRGNPSALLLDSMARAKGDYHFVTSAGYVFLVGVRGDNVRGYEMHRRLGTSLPATRRRDWILERQDELTQALDDYSWPTSEVHVCGRDGAAFIYKPKSLWPRTFEPIGDAEHGVEPLGRDTTGALARQQLQAVQEAKES